MMITPQHSVFGVAAVVDRGLEAFSKGPACDRKITHLEKAFFTSNLERSVQGHVQGHQTNAFKSTHQGLSCVTIRWVQR